MSDKLKDTPTKHWTEVAQPIIGLIRVDGHTYRWMGAMPRGYFGLPNIEAMTQTSVEDLPLHSIYHFAAGGIQMSVTFLTPLFPKDLDVMPRPVTYLSCDARAVDGKQHKVDCFLEGDTLISIKQPDS